MFFVKVAYKSVDLTKNTLENSCSAFSFLQVVVYISRKQSKNKFILYIEFLIFLFYHDFKISLRRVQYGIFETFVFVTINLPMFFS